MINNKTKQPRCKGASRDVINCYMDLVRMRASGELETTASWMRKFVLAHADYKGDSKISDTVRTCAPSCAKKSVRAAVQTDVHALGQHPDWGSGIWLFTGVHASAEQI